MLGSIVLFLNIGTPEIMLIMFVALLLFGGDKLPGLAKGLGKGIRDFKDASEGVKREINNQINSYDDKKTADTITPHTEVAHNDVAADESKPLIDTTPVAGTAAIGGHRSTDIDQVMEHNGDTHVNDTHLPAEPATVTRN